MRIARLTRNSNRPTLLAMATRKTVRASGEKLTKGAILAAKYRARANALTDEERQRLRAGAMSLIYGNPDGQKVHAHSR
jgi:hypothetical protein